MHDLICLLDAISRGTRIRAAEAPTLAKKKTNKARLLCRGVCLQIRPCRLGSTQAVQLCVKQGARHQILDPAQQSYGIFVYLQSVSRRPSRNCPDSCCVIVARELMPIRVSAEMRCPVQVEMKHEKM